VMVAASGFSFNTTLVARARYSFFFILTLLELRKWRNKCGCHLSSDIRALGRWPSCSASS
jgi:hypothetical protein